MTCEIVGVARQVKGRPDETEDLLQFYVPLAQNIATDIFIIVRPTSGSARALSSSVRAALAEVAMDGRDAVWRAAAGRSDHCGCCDRDPRVISIAGPAWRITRIDPLVVLRSE